MCKTKICRTRETRLRMPTAATICNNSCATVCTLYVCLFVCERWDRTKAKHETWTIHSHTCVVLLREESIFIRAHMRCVPSLFIYSCLFLFVRSRTVAQLRDWASHDTAVSWVLCCRFSYTRSQTSESKTKTFKIVSIKFQLIVGVHCDWMCSVQSNH